MIEEIINGHLRSIPAITSMLTTYASKPAVFNQKVPADKDKAWKPGPQYPRLVFGIDKRGNPERKIAATMFIDIMCSGNVYPEDLEPLVREAVDGYFFTDGEDTIALQWDRSDSFKAEPDDSITGVTILFDLLAFPPQNTVDPDPIKLLNDYTKHMFNNAMVIGTDMMPAVFKPTDKTPAFYWQFQKSGPSGRFPGSFMVTWRDCALQGYVMAPGERERRQIIQTIQNDLAQRTRLFFDDRSPFFVNRLAATLGGDPLKGGQLTIDGTYGLLRQLPETPKLNHVNMN